MFKKASPNGKVLILHTTIVCMLCTRVCVSVCESVSMSVCSPSMNVCESMSMCVHMHACVAVMSTV